jgi:hypothetical protein
MELVTASDIGALSEYVSGIWQAHNSKALAAVHGFIAAQAQYGGSMRLGPDREPDRGSGADAGVRPTHYCPDPVRLTLSGKLWALPDSVKVPFSVPVVAGVKVTEITQ